MGGLVGGDGAHGFAADGTRSKGCLCHLARGHGVTVTTGTTSRANLRPQNALTWVYACCVCMQSPQGLGARLAVVAGNSHVVRRGMTPGTDSDLTLRALRAFCSVRSA